MNTNIVEQVRKFQRKYLFEKNILVDIEKLEKEIQDLGNWMYNLIWNNNELKNLEKVWDQKEYNKLWKKIIEEKNKNFTKLFDKKNKELLALKRKWIKYTSNEEKIKYYKIFYLWNMWYAEKEVANNRFNPKVTIQWTIQSPKNTIRIYNIDTWIDMIEAEKVLINNNWDLNKSINDINYDRWLKLEYNKNDFIQFYWLLDEKESIKTWIYIIIIFIIFWIIMSFAVSTVDLPWK